jgi:hypothetical protein
MKFRTFTIVVLLTAAPLASAKTLSQFSTDVIFARSAALLLQQEDAVSTKEDARESTNELFPAMEGAKPVLTISQQNLLKRCERFGKRNMRCAALKCRLLGEGCKR